MNQGTRYMTFLGVVIAVLVIMIGLYDWIFFLMVPMPTAAAAAIGAAVLTRHWIAEASPRGRTVIGGASYVSAGVCTLASITCCATWTYSWKYGESATPAGIQQLINLTFAVAVLTLSSSLILAALALTLKQSPVARVD